jgi:hypothetical protein
MQAFSFAIRTVRARREHSQDTRFDAVTHNLPMPPSSEGAGPELTDRSRDSYAACDYAALTPCKLAEVTRGHGVDFATALLYDRIRHAEPHRTFIEAVDASDPAASIPPTSARLLIAPAAFWREYPQYGADGAAVLAVAGALGISAERIPTLSTGGATENARIIREALAKEEDGSVILVSLSKGGRMCGWRSRNAERRCGRCGRGSTSAGWCTERRWWTSSSPGPGGGG